MNDYFPLAETAVNRCRTKGATDAEVYIEHGDDFSVFVCEGSIESLKQSAFKGLGLRVFLGDKSGFAFTNDFSKPSIESIVDAAFHFSQLSDVDVCNKLPAKVPDRYSDLELFDPCLQNISAEDKIALTRSLEAMALAKDRRIIRTEGAGFFSSSSTIHFVSSKGSHGSYPATLAGISVSPVAESNGDRISESWYSYDRFFDKVETPDQVAAIAVKRTLRLIGARKIRTTKADIILEPSCGISFLSSFFSLINGDNVNRGLSVLRNDLGKQIAPDFVTIVDDGQLRGRIGSRPFDGEGIATARHVVVEKGVMKKFLYDTKAGLRAGVESTGHARRRYDSDITIGSNNFFVAAGLSSPEEIIKKTDRGLWVTKLMGFGFDPVSGMFSYGAAGVWIEQGYLAYPVHEVVIASDIKHMLANIQEVGNDLRFRGPVACPTLKISDVTIAGS